MRGEMRGKGLGKVQAKAMERIAAYSILRIVVPVAEGSNPSAHPKIESIIYRESRWPNLACL
jgi:hypothetical protein